MSGLLGGSVLVAVDYRATPPWFRDEEFYAGSSLVGGTLLTATWFEDVDQGWGGPNYAPWAEEDHGPSFSRGIAGSAALAIYDNP